MNNKVRKAAARVLLCVFACGRVVLGWSGHGRVSTGARCPKSVRKEVPVGLVTPARRVAGVVGRNMGFLRSVVRKWVGQCGGRAPAGCQVDQAAPGGLHPLGCTCWAAPAG